MAHGKHTQAKIVAHRGASARAPENTLEAFKLAWQLGADAIEGDFRLTRDKRIVCIHDATTQRVASKNLKVESTDSAQLRELDVGIGFSPEFRGARIPYFEEVVATVPDGKQIVIEIKGGTRIVPHLIEALEKSPLRKSQVFLICFNRTVLKQLKRADPAYKTGLLIRFRPRGDRRLGPGINEILNLARETGCDAINAEAHPSLSETFVRTLRTHGYGVHVWTVDSPEQAAILCRHGAESITTNKPGLIRRHLDRNL